MMSVEVTLRRSHLIGVILANAVLWVAAVLLSGQMHLGGLAVVALASLGSLLRSRPNC